MTYGTYELPDGTWQTIGEFPDQATAVSTVSFHSQGRRWKIADDAEQLERWIEEGANDE